MWNFNFNHDTFAYFLCITLNDWIDQIFALIFGNCSTSKGSNLTEVDLDFRDYAANSFLSKNSNLRGLILVVNVDLRGHSRGNTRFH